MGDLHRYKLYVCVKEDTHKKVFFSGRTTKRGGGEYPDLSGSTPKKKIKKLCALS